MTNTNDIEKNEKSRKNVNLPKGHIEIRGGYNDQVDDIDVEDILDVMGCKTRRDIINLLREEPMFVSEISNELDIGQKAIIEHLRAMEEIGILNSSYKKILRGRPRKYYDLQHEVNIHITINKNAIPGDPQKPTVTSGVRIGTAAVTTRGLGAEEMKKIAHCIALTAKDFEGTTDEVKATVAEICNKYPLY